MCSYVCTKRATSRIMSLLLFTSVLKVLTLQMFSRAEGGDRSVHPDCRSSSCEVRDIPSVSWRKEPKARWEKTGPTPLRS